MLDKNMIYLICDKAMLYEGSAQMDYMPPAGWDDEIIDHLIDIFPELEDEIDKAVYFHFSAHLVFDMILFPQAMKWAENNQTEQLEKLSDLLEKMLLSGDTAYINVAEVSFLESLVLEADDMIPKLEPHFHTQTLKSLQYWMDRYGKQFKSQ